ncbi:hypothetical protein [Archangium sp.]|uniref:hypothetical protein n=1 Tax=Archangium sp. TaxID=1872627 RepID=UPI002D5C26E7|nr:hypothetical protein [Archangium sp.]HYO59082.1 hypothetical protein [Archangium sp.]
MRQPTHLGLLVPDAVGERPERQQRGIRHLPLLAVRAVAARLVDEGLRGALGGLGNVLQGGGGAHAVLRAQSPVGERRGQPALGRERARLLQREEQHGVQLLGQGATALPGNQLRDGLGVDGQVAGEAVGRVMHTVVAALELVGEIGERTVERQGV